MKRKLKTVLAYALTLVMMFTLLPVNVMADEDIVSVEPIVQNETVVNEAGTDETEANTTADAVDAAEAEEVAGGAADAAKSADDAAEVAGDAAGDADKTVDAAKAAGEEILAQPAAEVEGEGIDKAMAGGNAQAKIGDKEYATLADAVAAAVSGDTIILLDNVTVGNDVEYKIDTTVTLDLNGKTVLGNGDIAGAKQLFFVGLYGDLTIKDSIGGGKLRTDYNYTASAWHGIYTIHTEGKLTLESGSIELNPHGNGIFFAIDVRPNAWSAGHGTTEFVMNGGSVSMDGKTEDAIRLAINSAANFSDEKVVATFNGGTISGWSGFFIQQLNSTYRPIELNINGGTIDGEKAAVRTYGDAMTSFVGPAGTTPIVINVNGGSFYSADNSSYPNTNIAVVDATKDQTAVTVSGGTFSKAVPQEQCAAGYVSKKNESGTYTVKIPQVAEVNGVTYPTLEAAVSAAQNGETVKLLEDITDAESLTIPAGKEIVIDLAGKTVSRASAVAGSDQLIVNKGNLTIDDSVGGGKLSYKSDTPSTANAYATNAITNNGTLTIEAGIIENLTVGGASYVVDNNSTIADTSLTVNGGQLVGNANIAVRQFANSITYKNDVVVNGGSVTGRRGVQIQLPGSQKQKKLASLTITGGSVVSTGENGGYQLAVYVYSSGDCYDGTVITITGGTVDGDVAVGGGSGNGGTGAETVRISGGTIGDVYTYSSTTHNIVITGGTFNYEPYDDTYIAEGYKVVDNKNDTYSVVEKDPVAQIGGTKYTSLEDALKAAVSFKGDVTVEILADIDLNGAAWPEITVDGAAGAGLVTVNGNNKSIKGLTGPLLSGTWAGKSGLVINDLTIRDSTIVKDENDSKGNIGVGAFIGYPQASETITLKNCHLVDSTVKGGHWTGGLIGIAGGYNGADGPVYMNLTIDGCSVETSNIISAGSVGGVIGHATNNANTAETIKNTTVTGNTITSTGSSKNKAGVVMGTVGTSTVTVEVTESNNTAVSGGTAVKRIYGRFGSNGSTLKVTGGSYSAGASEIVDPDATGCKVEISGGTFTSEPAAKYIVEGYQAKLDNSDNLYHVVEMDPVAQIGTVKYKKLEDALKAAKSGDVVTILVDGTYSLSEELSDITVKADTGVKVLVDYSAKSGGLGEFNNVSFEDISFKFGTANYTGFQKSDNISFKNCTLDGKFFSYGDMTFDTCTFNAPGSAVYGGGADYSMWCYAGDITYKNCTFNSAGKILNVYNEGNTSKPWNIVVDSCTFNSTKSSKAAINVKETCGNIFLLYDVVITNSTANGSFPAVSESDTLKVLSGLVQVDDRKATQASEITVTVDNKLVYPDAVAEVNGVEYADLAKALQAAVAAKGDSTVNILKDIDLKNAAWPEITVDGAAGAGLVTVNGNNKSIKGLTGPLFSGTWAGKSGLVINDLTIRDSTIVKDENDSNGNIGVGAFIGYPQASETITLKNCHLVDSTVKGGHWTGGLIGIAGGYNGADGPVYMNLTIDGCSVETSNIISAGSVGGVIGHATNNANTAETIKNTTVTGNTITSTGSSKNKAGVVMGTVGTSTVTVEVTESNNTAVSGGTAVKRIYGRFGSNGSTLKVTGGSYSANSCEFEDPESGLTGCKVEITGGAYAAKPDDRFIAAGYQAKLDSSDNMYHVSAVTGLLGDADDNGVVNMYDATLVLQYYVGAVDETAVVLAVSDVDGNGVVNMYDATLILQHYVGAITKFPVEE